MVDASSRVAEPDVGRGGEAVRVWGIEALRSAGIDRTRPDTCICGGVDVAAEAEHSGPGGAGSERVDRCANEG